MITEGPAKPMAKLLPRNSPVPIAPPMAIMLSCADVSPWCKPFSRFWIASKCSATVNRYLRLVRALSKADTRCEVWSGCSVETHSSLGQEKEKRHSDSSWRKETDSNLGHLIPLSPTLTYSFSILAPRKSQL